MELAEAMENFEALAKRCEVAMDPDRELDAAIAVALKIGCRANLADDLEYLSEISRSDYEARQRKAGNYWFHCRSGKSMRAADRYTASVDAALSLLPRTVTNIDLFSFIAGRNPTWGCNFMDTAQLMGKRAAKEQIARLRKGSAFGRSLRGPPRVELEKAIAEHFVEFFCRGAATAALAITAASLRARVGVA